MTGKLDKSKERKTEKKQRENIRKVRTREGVMQSGTNISAKLEGRRTEEELSYNAVLGARSRQSRRKVEVTQ